MLFSLDGAYLLTSYSRPYEFSLPTEKFLDGKHTITVTALMRDKFTSQPGSLSVIFKNGVASLPVNTKHFQPTSGNPAMNGAPFLVAAGGDGASGEPNATNVVNLIASLKPEPVPVPGGCL